MGYWPDEYLATDRHILIAASSLQRTVSSPTDGFYEQAPFWSIGDAEARGVGCEIGGRWLPADWTTFDFSVVWFNVTTDSGDVSFSRGDYTPIKLGTAMAQSLGSGVTVTASAQGVPVKTTLRSGITVDADVLTYALSCYMNRTVAADTKTGDIGILAFLLEKAS